MERELNEKEIKLQRENIVVGGIPTEDYYTKVEVDELLDAKASIEDITDIELEQTTQNTNIGQNASNIATINSNLINYSLITETGSEIALNINSSTYVMTAILKDKNGNVIYTSNEIDLPLETMVVGASYDNTTKEIVLILKSGATVRFSVASLVSGLVSTSDLNSVLSNYYTKTEIDNMLSGGSESIIFVSSADSSATILSKLNDAYNYYKDGKQVLIEWQPNIIDNQTCVLYFYQVYSDAIDFKGTTISIATGSYDYGINYRMANDYVVRMHLNNDEVASYELLTNTIGYLPSDTLSILGINNFYEYTPTDNYQPATKKYVDDNSMKSITTNTNIWELAQGVYKVDAGIQLKYKDTGSGYLTTGSYGCILVVSITANSRTPFYLMGRGALSTDTSNNYIVVGIAQNNSYGVYDKYDLSQLIGVVHTMNDQTINGVKTFNSLPVCSAVPSNNNQLVNKKYVDDAISNSITSALNGNY